MGVFDDIINAHQNGTLASWAASPTSQGGKIQLDMRPTTYRPLVTQRDPAAMDAALGKATTGLMNVALPLGLSAVGGPAAMNVGNSIMSFLTGLAGANTPSRRDNVMESIITPKSVNPDEVRVPVWSGSQSLFGEPLGANEAAPPSGWSWETRNDPRLTSLAQRTGAVMQTSARKPDLGQYADMPNSTHYVSPSSKR